MSKNQLHEIAQRIDRFKRSVRALNRDQQKELDDIIAQARQGSLDFERANDLIHYMELHYGNHESEFESWKRGES